MNDRPTAPRRGPRTTSRSVYTTERAARALITAGGLGTIGAVSLIFLFLVWVVAPLVRGVRSHELGSFSIAAEGSSGGHEPGLAPGARDVIASGVDDDRVLSWVLDGDGQIDLRRLDTGAVQARIDPFARGDRGPSETGGGEGAPVARPTAFSVRNGESRALFGFGDGHVRWAEIGFGVRLLDVEEEAELSPEVRALEPGRALPMGERGTYLRTRAGPLRATTFIAELGDLLDTGRSAGVSLLAHTFTSSGPLILVLFRDGTLEAYRFRERTNLLTGELTRERAGARLPTTPEAWRQPPRHLMLSKVGLDAYVVWDDGTLKHFDLRDFAKPVLIETIDLVETRGAELEAICLATGGATLVAAWGGGLIDAWFPVEDDATALRLLQRAHRLPSAGTRVSCLATSPRSRCIAAGTEDGRVVLYQLTTGARLADLSVLAGTVRDVAFAPKEDGLVVRGRERGALLDLDLGYPEASFRALVRPQWYEGYPAPAHVWQSTGSDDGSEPKLGLWPLVFGTLKATLFSMLFGAPLALLAAVFSSEFLTRRLHAPIKSTIELMASLPSVVLGFLAAMVFAPFVEDGLPFVLACFLTVPATVLLGAHLWQLLPQGLALRIGGIEKFLAITASLPIGLLLGRVAAPLLERAWFGGDVMAWLNGRGQDCAGAWAFLLLPVAGLVVALLHSRWVQPRVARRGYGWARSRVAAVDFAKFVLAGLAALLLSIALGAALEALGLDPRDSIFGPYDTRNALVVGFVMGFAIIPIIFTLADDALAEVPGHLREASLGAGATPWQTAARVVVPTAMSGLFSATMIGLGRAVGETMIVLMAAGSTPLLELNVFNGFRTLSANIATELPEAVQGSAHYRTLFLAALTLFAMTFLVNSLAEGVRRHFRRKAVAL